MPDRALWLALHLRWPPPRPSHRAQVTVIRTALDHLAPDIRHWHHLWHADGGLHLRLRLCCRTASGLERAWELLQPAAPQIERTTYRPDLWKFGGPGWMPLFERLFHCSSERAFGVLAGERHPALCSAVLDVAQLFFGLCTSPQERTDGVHALTTYGTARLLPRTQEAQRTVTALANAVQRQGGDVLALPSGLCAALARMPAPDRLGATLQVIHLHTNRLGLSLDEEALVYLAATRLDGQPAHNPHFGRL
ncbi:thiopeptide-type bacteriocin biosynthesis protein (plasmid) [Deinococcus sp. KNUC1210]|uniref:thiopeptide-type bacteriocin biosynthesis protein n=1 Tax=Deinococcus sp. KNUC1210 TaxID=2917691 RepID=UPI001EF02362|nr:thiopeptide-type bacteriocin biosynthesis protein [Deinococcus sp. KNUC1210]ULH17463.1 thiopeptide-type bacteriocin biosynthesis protein [Deinococcus sp. KNUC1210]